MTSSTVPLLVFADDWGRHPSSCQHLITRLKKKHPVVWINTIGTRRIRANGLTLRRGIEKLSNWNRGLQQVDEQMWVADVPMLPMGAGRLTTSLNRLLVNSRICGTLKHLGLSDPIVITTLPLLWPLIADIPRRGLIYYCTDDYSFYPDADKASTIRVERQLVDKADSVLAVSRTLLERFESYRTVRCSYFPHAVDFDHFASTKELTPATELAAFDGPRIGFFGLLYEKLNFSLLKAVAKSIAPGNLIMIGPIDYCPDDFRAEKNVRILGARPYKELPRWIAGFDVLLLPYVDDAWIRQSNPLKLRECLATGKPIVSVDVPEVAAYSPLVRIASTTEAYVEHVAQALREPARSELRERRQELVLSETWDTRAGDLQLIIDRISYSRSE